MNFSFQSSVVSGDDIINNEWDHENIILLNLICICAFSHSFGNDSKKMREALERFLMKVGAKSREGKKKKANRDASRK